MKLGEYEKIITNTQENDWTKIICWGAGSGPSYLNSFSVRSRGIGELDCNIIALIFMQQTLYMDRLIFHEHR